MLGYICDVIVFFFFFFKQKTAYEMRISDWSSDVCSSDLSLVEVLALTRCARFAAQSLTRWSSKMERSKSWLHGSRFSHPLPLQSTGDTSGIACEIRGQNDSI